MTETQTHTKARPIIFDAESVRAILAGRKCMTRRVVKPQPSHIDLHSGLPMYTPEPSRVRLIPCPYGAPGDLLWVKENFAVGSTTGLVHYRADDDHDDIRWKSCLFMPRRLSRLTLRVEDVRVERLQDITHMDVAAEGPYVADQGSTLDNFVDDYRRAFSLRWNNINGKRYPWEINPFVWAISFTRQEP